VGGLQVTESEVLSHRDQQLSTSLHCCWDSKAGMTHVRPRQVKHLIGRQHLSALNIAKMRHERDFIWRRLNV